MDNSKYYTTMPPEDFFGVIKPLKPENKALPTFPIHCFPPVIEQYVNAVSLHTQTAADMAAVIALGTLAVAVQGKYAVEGTPGYTEPLSLYTVIVALPWT